MKVLETMEASAAATRFYVGLVLYYSVVIQYLANEAECRANDGEHNVFNCPQGCKCDEHSKTVNCFNAGFRAVPRGIDSNTLSLILDHNPIRKLTDRRFGNLHSLQNLSLKNCSIQQVYTNAFSSFQKSLLVLSMSDNPLNRDIHSFEFLSSLDSIQFVDLSSTRQPALVAQFLGSVTPAQPTDELQQLLQWLGGIQERPPMISVDLSRNGISTLYRSIDSGTVRRKVYCKRLIVRANEVKQLSNHTFEEFPFIEEVDLSENPLSDIQPLAFRSNSLKIINLYKTNFGLNQNN